MKRICLSWVAVVAVITIGCSRTERSKTDASEQRPGGAAIGTGGVVVKSDEDFVHDVAIMNMTEIELSRMALTKATSPDVRSFAQRMIDDHGAAGDKLKGVISAYQMQWPSQLDDEHRKSVDELAKKQAGDFDREYAKAMVHGHQDLVAKLESRLDVEALANWKAAAAGRTQSKEMPDPKAELRDVELRPEKSDRDRTAKISQWAVDTYPVTQKHLDTARTLEDATKKRSTN